MLAMEGAGRLSGGVCRSIGWPIEESELRAQKHRAQRLVGHNPTQLLIQHPTSVNGLVVKFSVAIGEPRVRFPVHP